MKKNSSRRAYFTMVANDEWVIGAVVLGHSLRKSVTAATLICQVGSNVSDESKLLLSKIYDEVEIAKEYKFPISKYNDFSDVPERLAFSFRRLNAWNRTEFDRVIYLDSDLFVLSNIDSLFDIPGVAAPREYEFRVWKNGRIYTDFFNGGLVAFTPSNFTFQTFNHVLKSQWIYLGAAEQHLVNVVCKENWFRLPDRYHVQAGTMHNSKYAKKLDNIDSVHFSKISKPWDIAYTGRPELWSSWKIYAMTWKNMLKDYEHKSGNRISPDKFGWEYSNRLRYLKKDTAVKKKSEVDLISSTNRIFMSPTKMAEIAVFKGAFQKISELAPLIRILRRRTLRTVVEIGTFKGGTFWLWCQLAKSDASIISIDLKRKSKSEMKMAKYLRGLAVDSQNIRLVRGDSGDINTKNQLIEKLYGSKIDLLFIDGDHSYQAVKNDFEFYSPLVRKGGIVVFHDIMDPAPFPTIQVNRYWNELRDKYKVREFVDFDDERGWGKWGGIGVVYM